MNLPIGYAICPRCNAAHRPGDCRAGNDAPKPTIASAQPHESAEKFTGIEKELQSQIGQYLRLHGLWFDCDSMVKRRTGTRGKPDFIFAYRGVPCGVEAKTSTGKLSPDQEQAHALMLANGWRVIVARSVADVQGLMREIDAGFPV